MHPKKWAVLTGEKLDCKEQGIKDWPDLGSEHQLNICSAKKKRLRMIRYKRGACCQVGEGCDVRERQRSPKLTPRRKKRTRRIT